MLSCSLAPAPLLKVRIVADDVERAVVVEWTHSVRGTLVVAVHVQELTMLDDHLGLQPKAKVKARCSRGRHALWRAGQTQARVAPPQTEAIGRERRRDATEQGGG